MKIIVDAMGGDNAPLEIIKGSMLAVDELGCEIVLVGDKEIIDKCVADNNITLKNTTIVDQKGVIEMEDDPTCVIKEKRESSMGKAFEMLANGEGDGVVSAGNTGAVTVAATFIVKRIKGIKRPAIASMMPGVSNPFLLLDCGANVECRSEMLAQFGAMGDVYMKKVFSVKSPRVALVNNGSEETKGTETLKQAYQLMKEMPYNFTGNIEARQIAYGDADVVVADGFTGNIVLKMYEGVAKAMLGSIKDIFFKNLKNKIAALMLKSSLGEFKSKMDYKEYGGAVLLGVKKPVVKAHGSSDARSFKNAIRQCVKFANTDVVGAIEEELNK